MYITLTWQSSAVESAASILWCSNSGFISIHIFLGWLTNSQSSGYTFPFNISLRCWSVIPFMLPLCIPADIGIQSCPVFIPLWTWFSKYGISRNVFFSHAYCWDGFWLYILPASELEQLIPTLAKSSHTSFDNQSIEYSIVPIFPNLP